jgi:hypothetical protein
MIERMDIVGSQIRSRAIGSEVRDGDGENQSETVGSDSGS